MRVFYVQSFSGENIEYEVHYIRRSHRRLWHCTCGDYTNRQLVKGRHCKHIKLVRTWIRLAGGLRRIPGGGTWSVGQ